ncbi:MAG TPA: hypothetical protein PLC42_07380 [Parachlamydiaceae bacterium]|nr:hypothetical protein [Parachlamydiaceae bacterium]
MIKISSQQEADKLLSLPDWEDAFLRECYLLSPSYIDPNIETTIAPDGVPVMYMLICTLDFNYPAIELFFEEIEDVSFSCRTEINPVINFRQDYISFSFYEKKYADLRCKSLYYNILDQDVLGYKTRYGKKNIFDESGFLIFENLDS